MGASQQTQAKTRMTGAELIIRMLEQHGITSVSGIPGGAALPLYDALGNSRIRHILARHEQGAGFIAQVSPAPPAKRQCVSPPAGRVRPT